MPSSCITTLGPVSQEFVCRCRPAHKKRFTYQKKVITLMQPDTFYFLIYQRLGSDVFCLEDVLCLLNTVILGLEKLHACQRVSHHLHTHTRVKDKHLDPENKPFNVHSRNTKPCQVYSSDWVCAHVLSPCAVLGAVNLTGTCKIIWTKICH